MTELTLKTDDPIRTAAMKAGFGSRDWDDLQRFLAFALINLEFELFERIGEFYEVTKPADDAPAISAIIGKVLSEHLPKQ